MFVKKAAASGVLTDPAPAGDAPRGLVIPRVPADPSPGLDGVIAGGTVTTGAARPTPAGEFAG